MLDLVSSFLIAAGALFYVAGAVGLLRFPDTFTRLHALTKADNLGLGLVVFGLILRQGSVLEGAKLGLIWLITLLGSSSACYLLGRHALGTRRRAPAPRKVS